jgi:hypothetical protein
MLMLADLASLLLMAFTIALLGTMAWLLCI